jgi:hypothetical protein
VQILTIAILQFYKNPCRMREQVPGAGGKNYERHIDNFECVNIMRV